MGFCIEAFVDLFPKCIFNAQKLRSILIPNPVGCVNTLTKNDRHVKLIMLVTERPLEGVLFGPIGLRIPHCSIGPNCEAAIPQLFWSFMRTIEWDSQHCQLKMIDQRLLPGRFEIVTFDNYRAVATAIRDMVVRGAPAIGASAAFAMALAACRSDANDLSNLKVELYQAAEVLKAARPTASTATSPARFQVLQSRGFMPISLRS